MLAHSLFVGKVCATIAKRGVGPILQALSTLSADEDVQVSGIALIERISRSGGQLKLHMLS